MTHFRSHTHTHLTHAAVLLEALQDALGWQQVVKETAEAVAVVLALDDAEELPQQRGGRGVEGGVQRRERPLDAAVQRVGVLGEVQRSRGQA